MSVHWICDNSPDGVVIINEKGTLYANSKMADLLGTSVEELCSSNLEYVHSDGIELMQNRIQARLRGMDVPDQYELKLIKKDGSVRFIETHNSLIE